MFCVLEKCMQHILNHPREASSSVQMFVSAGGPGLCKVRDSHPCHLGVSVYILAHLLVNQLLLLSFAKLSNLK